MDLREWYNSGTLLNKSSLHEGEQLTKKHVVREPIKRSVIIGDTYHKSV